MTIVSFMDNLKFKAMIAQTSMLIMLLISSYSTFAKTINQNQMEMSPPNNLKINWQMGLSGNQFTNTFEQQVMSKFYVLTNLNYQALSYLDLQLTPLLYTSSGFSQSLNNDESNSTKWLIKNARANVNPRGAFQAQMGIINQSDQHHSLLFSDVSFPALNIGLNTENFQLNIESAIATANSLSTQTKSFEKTPGFMSTGLSGKMKTENIYVFARLNAFQFSDLPLSVSTISTLNGNSGINTSGNEYAFANEFYGLESELQLEYQILTQLRIKSANAVIFNQGAPENNKGFSTQLTADYQMNKDLILSPFYQYFEVQSDAAVAYYNDAKMNTNRAGYQVGLSSLINNKIKLSLSGGERSVLIENPNQENDKTWSIQLETMYAPL